MGGVKIPAGHTSIFFNVGSDRGDDVRGLLGFLGIQVALSSVNLLALTFLKGLSHEIEMG
jgi:hypothetical protein